MDLQGKRVLVTGASRGIGREIAKAAAGAGARVALVARNETAIKELAAELGGTAHPCDLSDLDQVRGLIGRIEADGGQIDVLVNYAGLDNGGPLEGLSEADLVDLLHVNLVTPLELSRQVLPAMVARKSGHIVNVSSYASAAMFPGGVHYGASKAGLSHATEVLRWELHGTKVDLTVVELGPIPTDMLSHVKSYRPTEAGFERLYKLGLIVDVPAETVAAQTIKAIQGRKKHVRLPRRGVMFPMLRASSQRMIRTICTGIPNR
jgi:short-subunit dehydrogenase